MDVSRSRTKKSMSSGNLFRMERRSRSSLDGSRLFPSFWQDNAEISAAMEHAHQVKHSVVITLLSGRNRSVPQLLDECLCSWPRRGGKAAHGCSGHHPDRVPRRERFAVEGVAVGKLADAFVEQKFLYAVAQHGFPRVLFPPRIIHRPIAHTAPGVVAEWGRGSVSPNDLRSVEIVAVRG